MGDVMVLVDSEEEEMEELMSRVSFGNDENILKLIVVMDA